MPQLIVVDYLSEDDERIIDDVVGMGAKAVAVPTVARSTAAVVNFMTEWFVFPVYFVGGK